MTIRDHGTRWPLVGREEELAAYKRSLLDRRNQGVIISGPAGVGKSRCAEECLALAVSSGYRGARATASAAAALIPLGAIAHLIPADVDLSNPVDGFTAVARALGVQESRWAVLIDDLQLLDATSVMLLRHLMDSDLIRIIGTVRTGEPLNRANSMLVSSEKVCRIDLVELGRNQVEQLLQLVLGSTVSGGTVHTLWRTSQGNALYLHELVLGALAAGTLLNDGRVWKLTENRLARTTQLIEVITARLHTVVPEARNLLELLALCEPISTADAHSVATPATLADMQNRGLIRSPQDQRRSSVSLSHPLYGEVLRDGTPSWRRRTLLLGQVERTTEHGARRREDILRIATWQLAATGTADPELLLQAANLAHHARDYPRIVELLGALPDIHHSVTTRLVLGNAHYQMGQWSGLEPILMDAGTRARDIREKVSVTLAHTSVLVLSDAPLSKALEINDAAKNATDDLAARHVLRINEGHLRVLAGEPAVALPLLGDLETDVSTAPDISAWLRGALAQSVALALTGRSGEAQLWSQRAYEQHVQVDEHALVAPPVVQLFAKTLGLTEYGSLRDAKDLGEDIIAQVTASGTEMAVRLLQTVCTGRSEWIAGHPKTALRWFTEGAVQARSINCAKILRLALSGVAACAAVLGDLETGQQALAEQRACPPVTPAVMSEGEQRLGEAWMQAAHGRLADARATLLSAAKKASATGHVASEALLLLDIARLEGAHDVAARLSELAAQSDGALTPARARFAAALATRHPNELLACADELAKLGADLLAAEAAMSDYYSWRAAGQEGVS
ncbi:AAA family ATPase, partial [Streptomyces sp. NPDC060027]|uniref:AAA family ATPase n=1 Tax=Streptomyces sp. NPDC060027 TaxID=3347040 RepID=UPI0036B7DB14